jgi:hypothetical protein
VRTRAQRDVKDEGGSANISGIRIKITITITAGDKSKIEHGTPHPLIPLLGRRGVGSGEGPEPV